MTTAVLEYFFFIPKPCAILVNVCHGRLWGQCQVSISWNNLYPFILHVQGLFFCHKSTSAVVGSRTSSVPSPHADSDSKILSPYPSRQDCPEKGSFFFPAFWLWRVALWWDKHSETVGFVPIPGHVGKLPWGNETIYLTIWARMFCFRQSARAGRGLNLSQSCLFCFQVYPNSRERAVGSDAEKNSCMPSD